MKFSDFLSFIGILAVLVALAYALAKTDQLPGQKKNVLQVIDVTGTNPSAPIPIQATLELHSDGRVTWKRPSQ